MILDLLLALTVSFVKSEKPIGKEAEQISAFFVGNTIMRQLFPTRDFAASAGQRESESLTWVQMRAALATEVQKKKKK